MCLRGEMMTWLANYHTPAGTAEEMEKGIDTPDWATGLGQEEGSCRERGMARFLENITHHLLI